MIRRPRGVFRGESSSRRKRSEHRSPVEEHQSEVRPIDQAVTVDIGRSVGGVPVEQQQPEIRTIDDSAGIDIPRAYQFGQVEARDRARLLRDSIRMNLVADRARELEDLAVGGLGEHETADPDLPRGRTRQSLKVVRIRVEPAGARRWDGRITGPEVRIE